MDTFCIFHIQILLKFHKHILPFLGKVVPPYFLSYKSDPGSKGRVRVLASTQELIKVQDTDHDQQKVQFALLKIISDAFINAENRNKSSHCDC